MKTTQFNSDPCAQFTECQHSPTGVTRTMSMHGDIGIAILILAGLILAYFKLKTPKKP